MGELAPVAGIASTAVVGSGSTADRSAADRAPPGHGRPPPRPPPAAPTPSPNSHGPAVELARQGLLLEALVRERAGPAPRSEANGLAGTVRVVPLAPGEPAPPDDPVARPGPWREGARLVTVLGPAGPDGLLAEADGITLLLRGARLHLPPGARLRIAWEGSPTPLDRPPPRLGPAAPPLPVPPASSPGPTFPPPNPSVGSRAPASGLTAALAKGAPVASSGTAPTGSSVDPEPAVTSPAGPDPIHGAPEPGSEAAGRGSVPDLEGTTIATARALGAATDLPTLGEAAQRLADFLGLVIEEEEPDDEERDRERGSGERRDPEEGRSRLVVVLPELGRVRLLLTWSARGVELAIQGLPTLGGTERAALLQAFEAALAAAGGRGRAVLMASAAGSTPEPVADDGPTAAREPGHPPATGR